MVYQLGMYAPAEVKVVEFLAKQDFDAIFIESKKEYVRTAQDANLKAYVHMWTFRAPKNEECYKVKNIFDERMFWSGSGCPNNPSIREFNLRLIEEIISNFNPDGIVLDGIRFPSPGSGFPSFLACFCKNCEANAKEMGYRFNLMKQDIRLFVKDAWKRVFNIKSSIDILNIGLRYLGIFEWIKFRCDSITEHIREAQAIIKETAPTIEFGTTFFAPSLASLVGQDYNAITQYADFIQPMIYHKGNGPACINYEIIKAIEVEDKKLQTEILVSIFRILGYERHKTLLNLEELTKGLPSSIISTEVEKVHFLVNEKNVKITPILFRLDSSAQEINELTMTALKAEPDGIAYFAYFEKLKEVKLNWRAVIKNIEKLK